VPVSQAELAESGVGGLVTDTLAHLVATTLKTIRDDNAGMRTFVFGAGASVHAGYPLAFDLWRCMEQWVRATPTADFLHAVNVMTAEFDLNKSFELVLTDLDNRIDSILGKPRRTWDECEEKAKLVDILRPTVKAMIPAYFDSLRFKPAEWYRRFANDVLTAGDAVITFNYDLALDRELREAGKWSIGNGYGFRIGDIDDASSSDSPCKLFKLHGSTHWLGELFEGRRGFGQVNPLAGSLGERPIIEPAAFEFLGYGNASDPQGDNGHGRIPSLIMPTANKKFFVETTDFREWESFWDDLWSQAGEALRASDEVYLIGYSIPEYDARARELLAKRIRTGVAIRICCHHGTADAVESLRRLRSGDANVEPGCATTFEDWVSCANLLAR
jgi:hypothetical protein